ncbi:MAG: hypothetical protein ACI8TQ_000807 [Planctomycetota bacterium]|jgi:hypothetical protein
MNNKLFGLLGWLVLLLCMTGCESTSGFTGVFSINQNIEVRPASVTGGGGGGFNISFSYNSDGSNAIGFSDIDEPVIELIAHSDFEFDVVCVAGDVACSDCPGGLAKCRAYKLDSKRRASNFWRRKRYELSADGSGIWVREVGEANSKKRMVHDATAVAGGKGVTVFSQVDDLVLTLGSWAMVLDEKN